MANTSTQGEIKSEPNEKQQKSGWWPSFKALGHGLLAAVGLRKAKHPLHEQYPDSCHLGGEPDQLAEQCKHVLLVTGEKLGLTEKYSEEEPSPSEAQERLHIE
ncbi:uncharacterized protein LOC130692443 [Daphnia carinata]|uniref:uncharacterized protein LOC130692443 n=1 Tax=Daphnia carinata TaxID=120202 RepID=UPI00257AD61A|nr:uncharacterized protein LOC130692443 [Daphnia carinata]